MFALCKLLFNFVSLSKICCQMLAHKTAYFFSNDHSLLSFRRVKMFSGNKFVINNCFYYSARQEGNVQPVHAWKIWTANAICVMNGESALLKF